MEGGGQTQVVFSNDFTGKVFFHWPQKDIVRGGTLEAERERTPLNQKPKSQSGHVRGGLWRQSLQGSINQLFEFLEEIESD